jgi:hypothetical protein
MLVGDPQSSLFEAVLFGKASMDAVATVMTDNAGSAEELLTQLQRVVPGATFPVAAAQALLELHNKEPLLKKRSRGGLNELIRQLGVLDKPNKSLRAELVMLQIFVCAAKFAPAVRSQNELSTKYGFPMHEVQADESLALFDFYIDLALRVVEPKNQMDFIILDVVEPLSEANRDIQSRRRHVSGGGSETAETRNRYYIYEYRSGYYRSKTIKLRRHLQPGAAPRRSAREASTAPEPKEPAQAHLDCSALPGCTPGLPILSNFCNVQTGLPSGEMNQSVSDTARESVEASSELGRFLLASGLLSPDHQNCGSEDEHVAPHKEEASSHLGRRSREAGVHAKRARP